MKQYFIITICIVSMFIVCPVNAQADEPMISDDCIVKMEQSYNQFIERVFKDILNTYQYLNIEQGNSNIVYFTMDDISNVILLSGKSNETIQSLYKFFTGGSIGERRLYFFNGEAETSYLLYKDTSHNNVLIKLKRLDGKWIQVGKEVNKGKEIELARTQCYDDFYINRFLYDYFNRKL